MKAMSSKQSHSCLWCSGMKFKGKTAERCKNSLLFTKPFKILSSKSKWLQGFPISKVEVVKDRTKLQKSTVAVMS